MPIKNLNARMRDIGQIRLGQRIGEKNTPTRLNTFRFTSANSAHIASVAREYGGEPLGWDSPRGDEWQVVTDATEIEIVLPPYSYLDQWMELWSAGGCQRRCDGEWEQIGKRACMCPEDPEERMRLATQRRPEACKPTTRLWVILPAVEAVGTWKLVTHSFYAAQELQGMANLLAAATVRNLDVPAVLRIDRRSIKRDGQTQNFSIPVIDVKVPITALTAAVEPERQQLAQAGTLDEPEMEPAETGPPHEPMIDGPAPEPAQPQDVRPPRSEPVPAKAGTQQGPPEDPVTAEAMESMKKRARAWHGKLANSSDPKVATMGAPELLAIIEDLGLMAYDFEALTGLDIGGDLDPETLRDAVVNAPGNPSFLTVARQLVQAAIDGKVGPA